MPAEPCEDVDAAEQGRMEKKWVIPTRESLKRPTAIDR
jgi:hypothetical protein